ncbi:hypothetical protein GCM10010313_57750 [Streptomyces violarus]|nr:hypothetical protein GCM10010313_57750 [Streptomyces violarus]
MAFFVTQATSVPVGGDLKAGRPVPHAGGPVDLTRTGRCASRGPGGGGEVPVPAA